MLANYLPHPSCRYGLDDVTISTTPQLLDKLKQPNTVTEKKMRFHFYCSIENDFLLSLELYDKL